MTTLACLMHWYTSLLYVVPVGAVGGWGWWSSRRMSKRQDGPGGTATPMSSGAESGAISDGPAY
jgi:hypothetical protein